MPTNNKKCTICKQPLDDFYKIVQGYKNVHHSCWEVESKRIMSIANDKTSIVIKKYRITSGEKKGQIAYIRRFIDEYGDYKYKISYKNY